MESNRKPLTGSGGSCIDPDFCKSSTKSSRWRVWGPGVAPGSWLRVLSQSHCRGQGSPQPGPATHTPTAPQDRTREFGPTISN